MQLDVLVTDWIRSHLQDLDLRGTLVSADALNTQRTTANNLVETKQADYLLVVKDNQPRLFDRLAKLSQATSGVSFPPDLALEQGHGRHETREVYPFAITPEQSGFPHAVQAALVRRTTHHLEEVRVTQETESLLSSRPADLMDAAQIQHLRRGRWGSERLHCVRDVTFGEDVSTVRTGRAPRNLATLRNLVIGLCGLDAARHPKRASYHREPPGVSTHPQSILPPQLSPPQIAGLVRPGQRCGAAPSDRHQASRRNAPL